MRIQDRFKLKPRTPEVLVPGLLKVFQQKAQAKLGFVVGGFVGLFVCGLFVTCFVMSGGGAFQIKKHLPPPAPQVLFNLKGFIATFKRTSYHE